VAGVLGARGDNGVGVAGAAWRVSIVPIHVDTVWRSAGCGVPECSSVRRAAAG
jgi:hypothetical protein